MSDAKRCDITSECIAEGDSSNPYWVLMENDSVTVLGVPNIKIQLGVRVDVFQDGTSCHLGQTARNAITQLIKNYVATL